MPRELLRKIFGSFSWTRPSWVEGVGEGFSRGSRGAMTALRPKLAPVALFMLVAVSALYWQARRERPRLLSVTGTAPGPTPLKEDAKPEPVHIDFGGSAARLDQIGKPAARGVTMLPRVKGEWTWTSDRRLTFTPQEDWAVGGAYVVRFDKKLFPGHARPETYEYRFQSAPLTGRISAEFYIDPKNPKLKQVVATVVYSHPIAPASLESRIALQPDGRARGLFGLGAKSLPFTLSYNKLKNEAYVRSGPMEIPPKDAAMLVAVAEGVSAARGGRPSAQKLEQRVPIPGLYSFFHVDSIRPTLVRNERYEPEQVLVLSLAAGALEAEVGQSLEVFILPKDLPPIQGRPGVTDYRWHDPAIIGPEVLSLSERVTLEPIPAEREYALLHSFKYKADVGRFLYFRIKKGLEAFGGYRLAAEFDAVAQVPEFPKELSIMQDGAILSLSGEKKLSILSRDLPAIRFELGRVLPGQINHLVSQSGGQFRSPSFGNPGFDDQNVSERFSVVRPLERAQPGKTQYTAFDLSEYMAAAGDAERKRGLFFFKVEAWDPVHKRPLGISDSRMVLVTDLGLLVKEPRDGSRDVFVVSIRTGEPVAGALVQVVGKNGLPVLSAATDETGRAHYPPLHDFKRERQPVVYVAHRGTDLSFIPFDWSERHLNLSRFDVGGAVTPQAGAGLDAYLFTDRGLYRPGDELRVGVIVKGSDWRQALAGVPLEAVITDPRGLEIFKKRLGLSAAAFEELRYKTEETSPTGAYQASVYIVKDGRRHSLLGSVSARVEEFLPDRLRIAAHLSAERADGWVSPESLKGLVSLKNLFGTPAAHRRVAGSLTLSPAYPAFRGYADYAFHDPQRAKAGFTDRLSDETTDEKGEASFPLNLERFEKATYRAVFAAEGYESEGGRGVGAQSTALVSSLDYLVGGKPDGDLRYVHKGSTRAVELIAVDPSLKKIAVAGLKAQIVEQRYVSALKKQNNGTFKYESILKELPRPAKDLSLAAAGTKYKLPTDQPGDFVLIVRGPDETEYNRIAFSVVGRANLTRSLEKNAELQIKLNKGDYAPGEEIELEIKAPYAGAGLITIERDKVYAYKWFKSGTTGSLQRIRVPESIEGNGYVNVSFIRSMGSPEIFMSPLSYGVAPFSVSRARRTNAVTLTGDEVVKPGERYVVKYRAQRPGKIVVFAVDEGILQVAGYKTPDPLGHFFEKRALEVATAQILDLILPEYKLARSLSAPGGDQGLKALGKNLNPFRRKREAPVACWSGVLEADAQPRVFDCPIPDYFNGTLRVMAVVVSPDSIGVGEKAVIVRGPFVLTPNVPTFVAPGDEFTVSVGVANNAAGSGAAPEIALSLKASGHVELLDGSSRSLKIAESREGDAAFRLKAKPSLGSANLTFTAGFGKEQARYSIDLSVRPPVPYMATFVAGHLKSGRTEVAVPRRIYPHYRTLEAAASPVPLALARGLVQYLVKYPYGCTEQLVSAAFPALVLRRRPEFGFSPDKAEANYEAALKILRARQNAEGAFGFWAANSHVSDFQTVYALHFLTEARDAGYAVPPDLLARGLGYLSDLLNRPGDSLADLRVRAYALYVLTRNGQVTTGFLNGLRAQLDAKAPKTWRKDLAGAYVAAVYKLLKQDVQADGLMRESRPGDAQAADYDNFYDGLVRDAQLVYLLAKHFPDRLAALDGDELLHIVEPVTAGSYNTLSSAYAVLALGAYADAVGEPQPGGLEFVELDDDGTSKRLVPSGGLFPKTEFSPQAKSIRIASRDGRPLFYQVLQSGFDMGPPARELKQKLEVQREYRDAKGRVVTSAPMGEELEVHVKVRAVEGDAYRHVAVVDLLPGGFDPVIKRDDGGDGEPGAWRPDYVDFREDRVVVFGTVGSAAQEFVYRIKAANKGAFSTPPIFAESMYDRSARARGLGGSMTVTGN